MARGRKAPNPAKVKAQARALDEPRRGEGPSAPHLLRRRVTLILLGVLSAVLLTASLPPFDQWYLAYVALVPWILLLSGPNRPRERVGWAALAGLLFWAGNLYWLWWITLAGYAALAVYLSAYWLVAALLVRGAIRRRWPLWIVFPIVWVALEYARAYVISGFPWFFLAQTQYEQVRLIQIADATGQYGVSFLVAMVNGALADGVLHALTPRGLRAGRGRRVAVGMAGAAIAVGGVLGYGTWRLGQETKRPGPVIGVVQHAFPISLAGPTAPEGRVFERHVEMTMKLIGAECDLVLWPETMLPTGANAEFALADFDRFPRPAQEALRERARDPRWWQEQVRTQVLPIMKRLSERLGCPLLVGGGTVHVTDDPEDPVLHRNSALLFDRSEHAPTGYSKMHLVPFSECVPFKYSFPPAYRALRWFVPPVMSQLEPGTGFTHFRIAPRGAGAGSGAATAPAGEAATGPAEEPWRIATPICYEGTFARIVRSMVWQDGAKQVDVLANLSNDGWFIWQLGGQGYHNSTEHVQHLAHYAFRAVENRVPVVRAVNTGISASVDSDGRIVTELQERGVRTMIAGVLLLDGRPPAEADSVQHGPRVLVDGRVSVYSRYGDVFAIAVLALAAVLTVWMAVRRVDPETQGAPK